MAVTEYQRHQLFVWFEERMGLDRAATMMELLPRTGLAELATKQQVAELEVSLTKSLITWLLASQATVVAATAAMFIAFR